ncbi:MAG: caspase family protein, partial [Elusimicrobia bacterium]|nr:caspase family protein [Elusimicrobiota bacterium]
CWVLAIAATVLCAAPAWAASKRALLIGISQYLDPEMNDLAYADEDVKTFASMLKGFSDYRSSEITLILNDDATKATLVSEIQDLVKASKKKPLDQFILMYAGHGLPAHIESRKTNSFLAPHDAYLNEFFPEGAGGMLGNETFINKAWLIRQLTEMNARDVIIILDSCYSGARDFGELYAENLGFKTEFASEDPQKRGITVLRKKGARAGEPDRRIAFLASSRENQPSAEYPELRHGALSYTLFERLNAIRLETEAATQAAVTVGDVFRGISTLFDTVKVRGESLSRLHQPVLVPIPAYDEVQGMTFVSIRGVRPPKPIRVAQAEPEPAKGRVYLDTGEDVGEVHIDGEKTGKLSNSAFELPAGRHLVSVYLPETRYNRTLVVDVAPDTEQRVDVSLRGRLEIESKPGKRGQKAPELEVFLDGEPVGRSPLTLRNLVAGSHTLTVKVNDVARERKVEIRPDSPLLIRYKIVVKPAGRQADDSGADSVTF